MCDALHIKFSLRNFATPFARFAVMVWNYKLLTV
jgi:hypothetical protein